MTASAPTSSAFFGRSWNQVDHDDVLDALELEPDRGAERDRPGPEHHDLVRGSGPGPVDGALGHRHRLVERGDVERDARVDLLQALAQDGALDLDVLRHRADGSAGAQPPGSHDHRVDHHVVANVESDHLITDLHDLTGGFEAQGDRDRVPVGAGQAAGRHEEGVCPGFRPQGARGPRSADAKPSTLLFCGCDAATS